MFDRDAGMPESIVHGLRRRLTHSRYPADTGPTSECAGEVIWQAALRFRAELTNTAIIKKRKIGKHGNGIHHIDYCWCWHHRLRFRVPSACVS